MDIVYFWELYCDLVVMQDISKLWNTKIAEYCVAAVECAIHVKIVRELSIPKPYTYFHSGVLLINLKKWREHRISQQVVDYIHNNHKKLVHPDQDALNAILFDKWLKLDPKWNFGTNRIKHLKDKMKPAIIHFTGKNKPWNYGHPAENEYHHYRKTINWVQTK